MPTNGNVHERLSHTIHAVVSVVAVAVGLIVLVGWWADIAVLKSVVPGFATMKANTALLFVLSGLSLWATTHRTTGAARFVGIGLASAVELLALLTLAQYALVVDLGIDQLLVRATPDSADPPHPGRMAVATAILFSLTGAALLLLHTGVGLLLEQAVAVVILLFSFLCCLSYLYGTDSLRSVGPLSSVAVHTAATFLLVAVGLLAATPTTGLVALFVGENVSGVLVRRLLPVAVLAPTLAGWLRLKGQQAGWYGFEFGLALFAISNITLFTTLVVWAAFRVEVSDAKRQAVTDALSESERRFRVVVESFPAGVVLVGRNGKIALANTPLEQMFGYAKNELHGLPIEQLVPDRFRDRHPGHRSSYFADLQARAMGSGRDLKGVRKDGSEFPVEIGLQPVEMPDGLFILASVIDITSRLRTEAALRESDLRYRVLLEGVPQLVWTCRSDGWCDYLSRQWVEYTGVPEADQLGYEWANAVHPDDRPVLLEQWGQAVRDGGPLDVEFRIRSGSGDYRWFKTRAVRFRQTDGESKWFGTNTDIHDRKLAEEQLRELNATLEWRVAERTADLRASEAEARMWAEAVPQIVWVTRPDGWNIYFNQQWMDYTGLTLEESLGHGWNKPFHPEDQQRAWLAWQNATTTLSTYSLECRLRRSDGSYRWWLIRGVPLKDAADNIIKWFGTCTDIDDLKRAEAELQAEQEKFRNAFEYAPIGMALVGLDGQWLTVNRLLCELTGYTEKELMATDLQTITHQDDLNSDLGHVRQLLDGTIQTYQMEKRYIHKRGHVVHVLLAGSLVRSKDGRPLYFVAQIKDISERKRAERMLAAHDALLKQFVKHSPAAIAMFDREVRYIQASDEWITDYGLEGQDVIGRSHYELFPNLPARWKEVHKRVLAGAVEACEEDLFHRDDGSTEWLRWECRPWHDAEGEVGGLMMFGLLITKQKRAEEVLRASEERFQSFIDHMPAASWVLDADSRVVFVNRYYGKMVGVDPASLTGKTAFDLYPPEIAGQHQANDRHVLATGTALETTEVYVRPDQTQGIVEVVKFPVPNPDGRMLIGGVATDVTERRRAETALRESEERYRSVIASLAEGVVIHAANGSIVASNDRASQILGLSPDQIAGRTSLDPTWGTIHEDGSPFPGEDHPAMVTLRTGNPVFDTIMGVRKPSGDHTWVTVNAVSVRSVAGTPSGVVASFHDITEARRLHDQARASLREKEFLLKEIHHRVKNNLQIISTLLDLQSKHTTDRAALAMFKESRGRVKSMALIHERLYRSQDVARVNFSEYVRQLAAELYRSYKLSDDDIRLELDVNIPPLTIDIAIPCGLLLNELMSNCLKHAFKDVSGGCIRVALHGGDGEPNVLTVADDGAGFPGGTDFRNTTSFGMQLVVTLAEQLHGEIELTTDRGTAFTVRFPTTKQ